MNIVITLRSGRKLTLNNVDGPFVDFINKNQRCTPQGFMTFSPSPDGNAKHISIKYEEIETIEEVEA